MKIAIISDAFPEYLSVKESFNSPILTLAQGYLDAGHSVIVVTTTSNVGKKRCEQWENDLIVYRIYKNPFVCKLLRKLISICNPIAAFQVRAILKKEKPDIIHAQKLNRYLSYFSLCVISKYAQATYITIHDDMGLRATPEGFRGISIKIFFNSLLYRRKLMYAADIVFSIIRNCTEGVIVVSEALGTLVKKRGLKNVRVIYNGINPKHWHFSKETKEIDEQSSKTVLYVGGISSAKGIDLIIKAMERVRKTLPDVQLHIAGSDNGSGYQLIVEKEARQRGVPVVFLGRINGIELRTAYAESDLVLTFSITNPFSMVAHEARAAQVPVVWGSFSSTEEVPPYYRNAGFLSSLQSVGALSDRIICLLSDLTERELLLKEQKKLVKDFLLSRQIEELTLFFQSSLRKYTDK